MKYLHKSQRLEYFGPQERDELMLLHGGGGVNLEVRLNKVVDQGLENSVKVILRRNYI